MAWDSPVEERNQIVLFARRLDDVLPKQHGVRRMVEVLEQLDWTSWETEFRHEGRGRPPIHPRVMSGIILYGLMRGVRSSRQLEEALQMRLDFRWLAEGPAESRRGVERVVRADHAGGEAYGAAVAG